MKENKVGVKFILNQTISLVIEDDSIDDSINDSPIYAQVTYMRKNTKFRVGNEFYSEKKFRSRKIQNELSEIKELITTIIRAEHKRMGNKFTLKGLGSRFAKYYDNVLDGILSVIVGDLVALNNEIADIINKTDKEFEFYCFSFGLYFIHGKSDTKSKLLELSRGVINSKKFLSIESLDKNIVSEIKKNIKVLEKLYKYNNQLDEVFDNNIFSILIENNEVFDVTFPAINELKTVLNRHIYM